MKFSFLLFSILLISVYAIGQRREKLKKNKFNSEKFKLYDVEVKKKWFDSIRIKFTDNVTFIDGRADKSKLGFIRAGEANQFFNIGFSEDASPYINSRTNGIIKLSPGNGNKMLIVIRHFWLSQLIVKAGVLKSILLGPKGFLSYCYFSGDYYIEKGGEMQYAGKMDSVFNLNRWMGHSTSDLVKDALQSAIEVGDSLASKSLLAQRITNKELLDSLEGQFNYPILKTNEPKPGVYLSYYDFLNNTPLEVEFELKTYKGDEYLLCKNTDTSITNKAWGYCDEEGIFKHINDEYYKMTRVQNTFELAGPRQIKKIYSKNGEFFGVAVNSFLRGIIGGGTTIFLIFSDKSIMNELIPYQLNIQKGTFY